MERPTIQARGPSSPAPTPYTSVSAPATAFGDAAGGMADLGRGITSLGVGVASIAAERDRRKAQDMRQKAIVSSDQAKDAATQRLDEISAKMAEDPDSFDESTITEEVTRAYQEALDKNLSDRNIDPAYTKTDEFRYYVRNPLDDIIRLSQKTTNQAFQGRRIRAQSIENRSAFDHFDDTGDFSRVIRAVSNTHSLSGVPAAEKGQVLRDAMESAEIRIPGMLAGKTPDERASFAKWMVDSGIWTAERATAVTRAPVLDDASKARLRADVINAADKDDSTAVAAALTRLSGSIPEEDFRAEQARARAHQLVARSVAAIRSPDIQDTLINITELRSELRAIKEDTTGTTFLKNTLSPEEFARLSEPELRSLQSRYGDAISLRINELETNPSVALERVSVVAKAASEVTNAIGAVMAGSMSPDSPEVMATLARYNDTLYQTAGAAGVQIPHASSVPRQVSDSVLAGLMDPASRDTAGAFYLSLASMPGIGQAVSDGVRAQAWASKDPAVRASAPYLHIASTLNNAAGPSAEASSKLFLMLGLDQSRIDMANKAKVSLETNGKNGVMVTPDRYLANVLQVAAPGTAFNESILTDISGIYSSRDNSQVLSRYADALANQEVSRGIASGSGGASEYRTALANVALSAASSSGGAVDPKVLFDKASELSSLMFSSGLTVVRERGSDVISQNDLLSNKVASVFMPAEPGLLTDVTVGSSAAQAVVDYDDVMTDRYSLEFTQKNKIDGGIFSVWLGSHVSAGIEKYRSWNPTFLGMDLGSVDIDARYFTKEVAKELGMDVAEEIGELYQMGPATFSARTEWRTNQDGTRTRYWREDAPTFFGGRASSPVDRRRGPVLRADGSPVIMTRAQVSAARDYIKLQGTWGGEGAARTRALESEQARRREELRNLPFGQRVSAGASTRLVVDSKLALARELLVAHTQGE